MTKTKPLEQLVTQAAHGSMDAMEQIVKQIQGQVYNLSLRMLLNAVDAEDATQEILTTVITNLGGYRFEGPFRAWVMRIAVNRLKSVRKSSAEKRVLSIENLDKLIDRVEAQAWSNQPKEAPEPYLEIEMQSICTHAALLTLNRAHRLVFILAVVMEVSSKEGALILDITPSAFRKRLSRARSTIKGFMQKYCGLFDTSNRCRCKKILPAYLKAGFINPDKPLFVSKDNPGQSPIKLMHYLVELNELSRISAIYKSASPATYDFVGKMKAIISNRRYRLLSDPKMS